MITLNETPNNIWTCKIGETLLKPLPPGADAPMRNAVEKAYRELTGYDNDFCFSGWGGLLTFGERNAAAGQTATTVDVIARQQILILRESGILDRVVELALQDKLLGVD